MKKLSKLFVFAVVVCLSLTAAAFAQKGVKKAPDYKITNIKVLPYSENTGKFGEDLKDENEGEFFNRLDVGLFVTVEISGSTDSFETGRKVQIRVTEGRTVKLAKLEQVGYMGDNAKTYYGFWLAPSMCSRVTITATLIGQKTPSKMSRKIAFLCGE
jgi:hypothetical protein